MNIKIHRDANGGLGLSIAGGLESTPYKDDDTGLFISKLTDDGPAMVAGLRVGDKLLRVNKTDVVNVCHQVAVTSMQDALDVVELTILRDSRETPPPSVATSCFATSSDQSIDNSFVSESVEISSTVTKETISTTIQRDFNGSPGFSVASGTGDVIVISSIASGGAAERDGKLRVGDRVLSINGTNVRNARHDQAVALLTGHCGSDIYLVVQRDANSSVISPSSPNGLEKSSTSTNAHTVERLSPLRNYGFGDPSWDGTTEEVELVRDNHSLGLSIVGGSDHSSHPFGINAPGVFISKIIPNSPAGRSQRLRIGDRILSVNNTDIRAAKHRTAVEALKQGEKTVRLLVIHEPQPPGLRQITINRNVGEPLGFNICGGIHSPPANPLDLYDEGIFIEKIERNGPAAASSLTVGTRILEVNDESLLGCSQEEAAQVLRQSGSTVRILVCDAFSLSSATASSSVIDQTANSKPVVSSEFQNIPNTQLNTAGVQESLSAPPTQPFKSPSSPNAYASETRRTLVSHAPLAASPILPISSSSAMTSSTSSLPQTLPSFVQSNTTFSALSFRPTIPPPIAPKPKAVLNQVSNIPGLF